MPNPVAVNDLSPISGSLQTSRICYGVETAGNDYGQDWNTSVDLTGGNITGTTTIFRSSFVYDNLNAMIVGDNGFIFYTNNGGVNWTQLTGIGSNNYTSIYITNYSGNIYVFLGFSNSFLYFQFNFLPSSPTTTIINSSYNI